MGRQGRTEWRTAAGAGADRPGRPLRLLLLAPSADTPGGVATYAGLILDRLSPAVRGERLPIGRRPGERAGTPLRLLRDYLAFACRLLRRERPDLIHVNPTFDPRSLLRDGLFLALARLLRHRGVVVTFHGWDAAHQRRVLASPLRRRALRWALGRVARIYVLAEPFREALLSLGLEPEVVAFGTTMFDGRPLAAASAVPDAPRHRILFLSRFLAEKGGAELIAAFAALHAEHPGLVLTMAGGGPEEEAWRKLAGATTDAAAIEFAGYVGGEAKARLLREALAFVLPSRAEGMPVALLEAMGAGAAVLVTAVGGVPLVVRPGEQGLLLPDGTAASVEAGLRSLLHPPGRAEAMGRAARAAAWERYEAGQVVAALEREYRRIAGRT